MSVTGSSGGSNANWNVESMDQIPDRLVDNFMGQAWEQMLRQNGNPIKDMDNIDD